ncbi:MAG: hypothetical protein OCD76_00295 [Reichenbachiella sp.]
MRHFLLATLLILSSHLTFSQMGDLFLTHHKLDVEGVDNLNFEIVSNSKGQLCIANRSGLLFYDGHNWDYIATPSSALSINFDENDNIYVGCVGDFGRIGYKDKKYQFISLNPNKTDHGLYSKTLYKDSSIYFLSENIILRHHIYQDKSYLLFLEDEEDYFKNIFEVDGKLLVQTHDTIMHYQGDSLAAFDWDIPKNADFIFFDKHPTQDKYVAGTSDNRTFIYRAPKFYECKISNFLEEHESFVTNGKWVNERYFALSTLEDGCILYDNQKSEILEVVNQSKGLPDNQIFTIGQDQEEGLWISHEYGLSRLEINIPFRSFSNFQGLHGNISEMFFHKRKLYVATSEGVYYLDKQNIYKNTVHYKEVKRNPVSNTSTGKKKRKGNKKKSSTPARKTSKSAKTQYIKQVEKKLLLSKFAFKPVEGIHSKTDNFIVYKNKLLVSGTNGVYSIEDGKGELVIHEPVRLIEKERKTDRLIISTYFDEIKLYELQDDQFWIQSDSIDLHGNLILNTLNDASGRTWFITPEYLYEFNALNSENPDYNTYEFDNPFVDQAKLAYIDQQLYLINNQGYFYLDTTLEKIVEDSTLMKEIGRPVKHHQQRNGLVWVYNGENWFRINKDKSVEEHGLFRLFPEMNFISEFGGRLWLVNDHQEILQHDEAISDTLISKNHMFFRKVTTNKGDAQISEHMYFDDDETIVHFQLSRPDYRGILNTEFQYKLKGLNDAWSEWSEKTNIDFNYLHAGIYTLDVRSRDSFGHIQESENIKFTVRPHYWQTLWFYGLQIALMLFLVVGSIILNRRAHTKYVLVTEALSIITIVMIIEFLQSAAGNYLSIQSSPVVDFALDVGIALLVFPLEQLLKKYMKVGKSTGPGLQGKGFLDLLKGPFQKKEASPKKKAVSEKKEVVDKKEVTSKKEETTPKKKQTSPKKKPTA